MRQRRRCQALFLIQELEQEKPGQVPGMLRDSAHVAVTARDTVRAQCVTAQGFVRLAFGGWSSLARAGLGFLPSSSISLIAWERTWAGSVRIS